MIKPCKCVHPEQDKLHGKGNRVHTVAKNGDSRCTVCGPLTRWVYRLNEHAKNWLPIHAK